MKRKLYFGIKKNRHFRIVFCWLMLLHHYESRVVAGLDAYPDTADYHRGTDYRHILQLAAPDHKVSDQRLC